MARLSVDRLGGDPRDFVRSSNKLSVKAKLTVKRISLTVIVVFLAAFIGVVGYQIVRAQLADRLLRKVDRLSLQTPDGVTDIEWAMLVHHTHNLHCSAIPQIEMSITELRALHRDLDTMLVSGANRDSIDYLWDEYSRLTPGGARHREVYESDRDARIAAALRDGDSYWDIGSYTGFLNPAAHAADE